MPVGHSDVGHVSARYVVTGDAATCVTRSKPVLLDLKCKIKYYVHLKKLVKLARYKQKKRVMMSGTLMRTTWVTRAKPMLLDLK